ncbi:MAG: hypothetical protein Q4B09_10580 [Lachnospiraceae bacterium]|nr:hypothetical protein [Lachnospiraceae bacterium]
MNELIFSADPYRMNWFRTDFEYAKVKAPCWIKSEVHHRREGDLVYTDIRFTNDSDKPLLTHIGDIAIAFPTYDVYEDSDICIKSRCHTHLFCGEDVSWIMALRMGGEAPHLGMVLTEGSLSSYSVERDLEHGSNDRGCFWLHPSPMEFAPGETKRIAWTIFPHQEKDDFKEKLAQYSDTVAVEADNYVLFEGEELHITVKPSFACDTVTVDGTRLENEQGSYHFTYAAEKAGEKRFEIAAGNRKTHLRVLVTKPIEELAQSRCDYIAKRQQYRGTLPELKGAYLAYDTEEQTHVYTPEHDFNGGRERIGMGILIARYLQRRPSGQLERSLADYRAYVERELIDPKTGVFCNDIQMDNSYQRLYNYPWAITFYCELYRLYGEEQYLNAAIAVTKQFYQRGGASLYPIELPCVMLVRELEQAGRAADAEEMKQLFLNHAKRIKENGLHYPKFEVDFEQSIVAPAADIMLKAYELSGDREYLEEGKRQIGILELFNGIQPDYHLHEVAIRHWDGYWFGKRRLYGDTFPHYWSGLTGTVFLRYARITGDASYRKKAEDSLRGVVSLFFGDGSASCAYVFPQFVNGVKADFPDPYANDQDWGLYFYLRALDAKISSHQIGK